MATAGAPAPAVVRPRPGRARAVALALASTVALGAGMAGIVAASGPDVPDTGRSPLVAAGPDQPAGAPEAAPSPLAPTTTAVEAPASRVGVRSGRLEDLPAPAPAPVRVRIDVLGIDAPVVAIGVDAPSGAVAVPDDVAVAGWYRFGPAPGEPGSSVLTAHVDAAAQGPGAFFPLREAEPGVVVRVVDADGQERAFEVVGRRSYPKASLPVDELFTRSGDPVLTLITCGGAFDPATRSYEQNVVVFAVPVA